MPGGQTDNIEDSDSRGLGFTFAHKCVGLSPSYNADGRNASGLVGFARIHAFVKQGISTFVTS